MRENMHPITWTPNVSDTNGWKQRHREAIYAPRGPEGPFIYMLQAWRDYAQAHYRQYESKVGDDGVLGPEWATIGASLRALLNGDMGRLDCSTLDQLICHTMLVHGVDPEDIRHEHGAA